MTHKYNPIVLHSQLLRNVQHLLAACLTAGMLTLQSNAMAGNSEKTVHTCKNDQTYWPELIVGGLKYPSSMLWLPNGDMLISERMGSLRVLHNGSLNRKPISGIPPIFQGLFDGIQDILLDPDFHDNQLLYLFISEGNSDQRHGAVYRGRYTESGIENIERIFRAKDDPGRHAMRVSRMIFLHDKTLLLAVAEDHHELAQQMSSHRGKILRINRDGSIPTDNPFPSTPGVLPEIWSFGHRVPLGMHQDPQTGLVLEVEAGPRGGDELNLIKPGRNYGWADASWGFAYSDNGLESPRQSGPGIEDPILIWMPSVTPSSITRYQGQVYPSWDGDYFVGHLTDKSMERLRIIGDRVLLQERMLVDLEERIRDVKVGPDNHIYILTDHQNGRVLRLQLGSPRSNQLSRVAYKSSRSFDWGVLDFPTGGDEMVANMEPDELTKGRQHFVELCSACHRVGSAVQGGEIGPDLADIYGSLMGRKNNFDYSPEMADSVLVWGFATLNIFLTDPNGLVPGTKMMSPPVTDENVRRYIVGFLKQQSFRGR